MAMLGIVITCKEFDDFIVSYLDNTLPRKQRLLFQAHLALCPACRNYLKNYEQTIALSRAACKKLDPPRAADVPDDLVRAILTARRDASHDEPPT